MSSQQPSGAPTLKPGRRRAATAVPLSAEAEIALRWAKSVRRVCEDLRGDPFDLRFREEMLDLLLRQAAAADQSMKQAIAALRSSCP